MPTGLTYVGYSYKLCSKDIWHIKKTANITNYMYSCVTENTKRLRNPSFWKVLFRHNGQNLQVNFHTLITRGLFRTPVSALTIFLKIISELNTYLSWHKFPEYKKYKNIQDMVTYSRGYFQHVLLLVSLSGNVHVGPSVVFFMSYKC